jgi:hypothetical protein
MVEFFRHSIKEIIMTSYYFSNKRNYTYIVESNYKWNKEAKRNDNVKINIGTRDNLTGKIKFYDDFLNRYNSETITISSLTFKLEYYRN